MRYVYGLAVVMLACLAGCKKEEVVPKEGEPPPPKTVGEIYNDYKGALQPLLSPAPSFTDGQKGPVISQFSTVRSQMREELNEPEAKEKIEKDVSNSIKSTKRTELWYALDGLLDVHRMLRPDSQVHTSLRRRTDLMLARPWVKCTGFATIGTEELLAFLEITDPKTKKVDTVRVREGEEFYPDAEGNSILRMIRVIGAQSGIEMEYLALPGETWKIPGPKNN